jgi:hypothetical protein
MKKNVISRFAVIFFAALLTITASNTFAGNHILTSEKSFHQPHPDTPYMALVQIHLSGRADTPYVAFSIQPALVYNQVNSLVKRREGLFHVIILFVNAGGDELYKDDFYIDNRSELNLSKQYP